MFNIEYVNMDTHATHYYLADPVPGDEAKAWLNVFVKKYVGKPYPNGKGMYPFCHARIVKVK